MNDAHLTGLAVRGLQGLTIDEPLPQRLVIQGPNESGKTARLRAIAVGLLGPPNKDGLAPWATTDVPSIVVRCSTGLSIQRATKITREGGLSCQNRHAVDPSQGEKTEAAVAARIETELRPNVISLTLDAFWKLSGAERRRTLLDALGADAAMAPGSLMVRLDTEFDFPNNPVWSRVRAAARAVGDGFAYLTALEGAAKAQASEYRAQKQAQDALAKAAAPAGADPVALEAELKAAQIVVDSFATARAAGERGAGERMRVQKRRDGLEAEIIRALKEWNNQGAVTAWLTGDVPGLAAACNNARVEIASAKAGFESARDKHTKETGDLERTFNAATANVGKWTGRIAGLVALRDGDGTEAGDRCCGLCGKPGFTAEIADQRIAEARKILKSHEGKKEKAAEAVLAARKSRETTLAEIDRANRTTMLLSGLATSVAALQEADEALKACDAATGASYDPDAASAAAAHRDEAQAALGAAKKAEGERNAQQRADELATQAAEKERMAVKIQERVGPKGLQGELLDGPVSGLAKEMNARWQAAGKDGTLAWDMLTPRGEPDASLVWLRDGFPTPVRLADFSGGQRAVALACLIAALAAAKPDRMSVALIEAGEVDVESLLSLMRALADAPLANVVIATHIPLEDDAATGWEFRYLQARK